MKRISAIILLAGALLLGACNFTGLKIVTGSGVTAEETRAVEGFDAVDMRLAGDLVITQGDHEGITIEAEENLLPYIRTEVRGRTLVIDLDHTDLLTINTRRPMRFYLTMKEITGLELSGSGSITSDKIMSERLDIKISGSGDLSFDDVQAGELTADVNGSGNLVFDSLKTGVLKIDISGSGDCRIAGEAAEQTLNISGSGTCDNSRLESDHVKIEVDGSGTIRVNAKETLDVDISGSGDVFYSDSPKITRKVSGSGDLISE